MWVRYNNNNKFIDTIIIFTVNVNSLAPALVKAVLQEPVLSIYRGRPINRYS